MCVLRVSTSVLFIFAVVSFNQGSSQSVSRTFNAANQNQQLCEDVLAVNNQVLEDREVFNVSIAATGDSAVQLPRVPTSVVVFDDDGMF